MAIKEMREVKDEINNRTVARKVLGQNEVTTTVLIGEEVVFVIEEKRIEGGKTLTTARDNKGLVGGEWVE